MTPIWIVGQPGAGKSQLRGRLAVSLGLRALGIDDVLPRGVRRQGDEAISACWRILRELVDVEGRRVVLETGGTSPARERWILALDPLVVLVEADERLRWARLWEREGDVQVVARMMAVPSPRDFLRPDVVVRGDRPPELVPIVEAWRARSMR